MVVLHEKRKITSLSSSVIPLVDALQCKIALMNSVSSEKQFAAPHVHNSCSLLCLMTYYGLLNSIINAIDDSIINSDDSRIDLKVFNIKEQEKKNLKSDVSKLHEF